MVLLHNFSSLTFYSLMNKFTCIILFQPNNKLIILPNVNFAHYFQLPDEETKVWGYLNNLSLICSFIHSEFIKHLQCVWWCGIKANIIEFVVALRSSGRAGSKSPGYLVRCATFSNPVVHPGNYHTMQQNMLLWHFQKQNAR